jgi:hypothetical protein
LFNLGSFAGADTGESFPLPADSVLLWDRDSESTAVPDGFSIYTAADNRLIQGTTTLADAGTTGGSGSRDFSVPGLFGTTSNGAHGAPSPTFPIRIDGPPLSPTPSPTGSVTQPAGSHVHTGTKTPTTPLTIPSTAKPMGRWMVLITNSSQVDNVPINCLVFSESRPVFFTRRSFETHSVGLYAGTTTFSRVKAADAFPLSIAWSSSGAHAHTGTGSVGTTVATSPFVFSSLNSYTPGLGSHTHPTTSRSLTIFQQFKHLLPFMASANSPVKSGMIVMYKGASIPSGWKLCDGTNGTPNMNGFFLGYDNNENGHDVVKSNKRVDISSGSYPLPTTNPPSPTDYQILADFSAAAIPWSHSHNNGPGALLGDFSTGAVHASDTAPHSHTFPSGIFFPSDFVPDFIKLVFIQKE